jgi:hypothetical protein
MNMELKFPINGTYENECFYIFILYDLPKHSNMLLFKHKVQLSHDFAPY